MEAQEKLNGCNEHTHIIKGKRTKRSRPQSPIPFTIPTMNNKNSSNGDGDHGNGGNQSIIINEEDGENYNKNISSHSLLSMSEFPKSTEEEEDWDMAGCLILLAQGESKKIPKQHQNENVVDAKFNSRRRYLETTGKAAYCYVYECKTCNRTFPSFQALGGHRASHKKPKAIAAAAAAAASNMIEDRTHNYLLSDDDHDYQEDEELYFKNKANTNMVSSLSIQLGNNYKGGNKVHECSVCGTEFASGQALGGHMRRHRPGPHSNNTTTTTTTNTRTTLSLSPIALLESKEGNTKNSRNVFSLDLNLPAPDDDKQQQQRQQQQQQRQQQQQQSSLVFSGSNLVDCPH